jgi:hypothetical protein
VALEYITNFFGIASLQTMLVMAGALTAGVVSVAMLLKRKKIIINIVWLVVALYFLKQALGFYSEDIKLTAFAKDFKSQAQENLGIEIEKIVIEKSGSGSEHKVKLYGSNLPSKKDCEVRTVTIKEWGYPSTQFSITKVGDPFSCTDGSALVVTYQSAAPIPAQPAVAQGANTPATRDILEVFESKSKRYTLERLKPEQAANVFMLMSTQPSTSSEHPAVMSPNFATAKITEEKGASTIYPVTTLNIGGTKLLSSDLDTGDYMLEYLDSIQGEDDLLLVGVFAGGNNCDTSTQMIVADLGGGKYSVSKQFGRCAPSRWRQDNTVYFIYGADEYHPLEILALTAMPK